ncbi:MAG: diguanylate cyclase domain-containing protein [Trichloromonadaceae bacterium]
MLEQQVQHLFRETAEDELLIAGIDTLAARGGKEVYSLVLRHLTCKTFEPEQASRHWQGALEHRNRPADKHRLRPALLDYLQVAGELHDPRIVEAELLESIRHASVSDGLTGLFNQTCFKEYLAKLLADQGKDSIGRFAVVLLDLDHFKQYNDRGGHLAGDDALRLVAETLTRNIRHGDMAVRYGGEEFGLLLHRVNFSDAFAVVERIRRDIEALPFSHQECLDSGNLTLSAGIALFPEDGRDRDTLLRQADRELYRAKENRNCVRPSRREQRQDTRHKLHSLVEFALRDQTDFTTGMIYDISQGGLDLACDSELPPGAELQLRFRRPFWPVDSTLEARVRHTRTVGQQGVVRLGLEFVDDQGAVTPLLPWGQRPPGAFLGEPVVALSA